MKTDFYRGRRLRSTSHLRTLAQETYLTPKDFVQPIFVIEGTKKKVPVESMPGIERFSVDQLAYEIEAIRKANVESVLIFGVPDEKDEKASAALKENNLVQKAIREIKRIDSTMNVITDVCLCSYTNHGHCGHLNEQGIDNDSSLKTLSQMAVSHAQAGADVVAPSDMMDGRVLMIRKTLDESGFKNLPILSYSAKFASSFYGPFRDAADCAPQKGDRKSYQMDYSNHRQALREIEADIEEGADMVMVKPALSYLDVIYEAKQRFDVPVFAYNVSGEYSMVKAAAQKGWVDEKAITREILTSIKRAGADRIITYFAKSFS